MNNITVLGRPTADPEIKVLDNGTAIATFSVADNIRNDACFWEVVAFGKTAEFVENYVQKGKLYMFLGEVVPDNYTDKKGKEVKKLQLIVSKVAFCEKKGEA